MPSNRLEILLSGNVRDFNQKMRTAEKQADDTMGTIANKARDASVVLGGLAVAGGAIVKSFLDQAVQMQKYEQTLKAITGSTAAARDELEKYTNFAATTPFDLPGVVEGAVKMRALKVDVEKFLPLAGDLAATFDRSLPDASLALAKALNGSQDALTQLQDAFAVTKQDLKDAGAAFNESTGAIDVTKLDELRSALEKVISTKYGGTMKAQADSAAGAFSNLGDAIGQLKAAMGAELLDTFTGAAKSLSAILQEVNALPAPIKRIIAQVVLFGTAIAGMAAIASGAIAVFGPLAATITAYNAAQVAAAAATTTTTAAVTGATAANFGFTAATVGSVTAVGTLEAALLAAVPAILGVVAPLAALGAGLVYVTKVQADYNSVMEKSVKIEERVADLQRKRKDILIETADALKKSSGDIEDTADALAQKFAKQGKTDREISEAIIAAQDQRASAAAAQDAATVKRFDERIRALRLVKDRLEGTYTQQQDAEKKAADAAKQSLQDQEAAVESYKKKVSAGYFESSKAQLKALDDVLSGLDKAGKDYKELSLKRVALARKAADDEVKAAETARKESVEEAMFELDKLKAYGDQRLGAQRDLLKKILAETKLSADERRKVELDLIGTEESIRKKSEADRKRAEAERVRDARQSGRLRSEALASEQKLLDAELSGLEKSLEKGEDVSAQVIEQIKARQDLTEKILKQQASVEKLGKTAAEQAQIQKAVDAEVRASRVRSSQEIEKVDKLAYVAKRKSLLETLQLEEQLVQARQAQKKNVTEQDLVKVAKERLAISEQELVLQAQIAAAQAGPVEKQQILKQLELDLVSLRKRSASELANATSELKQHNDEIKKAKGATTGGVQSLDEFVSEMNDQFAGTDRKETSSDSEPDLQKAGNQLGVDPNARASGLSSGQSQSLKEALDIRIEIVAPAKGEMESGWAWKSEQT